MRCLTCGVTPPWTPESAPHTAVDCATEFKRQRDEARGNVEHLRQHLYELEARVLELTQERLQLVDLKQELRRLARGDFGAWWLQQELARLVREEG